MSSDLYMAAPALRQAIAQLEATAADAGRLCRTARYLTPNEAALLHAEFRRLHAELQAHESASRPGPRRTMNRDLVGHA